MNVPAKRLGERVRQILASRGLSLYRLSQRSAQIFGSSSPFFVSRNLYYSLAVSSLRPDIHELLALSRLTNYRLSDWLAVFGFNLDRIIELQALLPRKRTSLLDSSVYDGEAWIPWFVEKTGFDSQSAITPLGQILTPSAPVRARELLAVEQSRFLYAQVGQEDLLAFPDLRPGSIVRIDRSRSKEELYPAKNSTDRRIFLVEHELGLACSRLSSVGNGRVTFRSPQLLFPFGEFALEKEIRILGIIDREIRCLPDRSRTPARFAALIPRWQERLPAPDSRRNLRQLLRHSRVCADLSFREASQLTRSIAQRLADPLYFTAASTLSDYETLSAPPRHVQKILTLCILYAISFWDFLRSSGLSLNESGVEPIPDELIPREVPPEKPRAVTTNRGEFSREQQSALLGKLHRRWQEIPLFLRKSLSGLTGIAKFSLSDVYWVGADANPLHPFLESAEFVAVNRRFRIPVPGRRMSTAEQPLYLFLVRDGRYLCGSCTLDQGRVTVHPYPDRPFRPRRFQNGVEAEVIGQVSAILRRLSAF
jgi:transcriptional regulator with XRE-family HTH domain